MNRNRTRISASLLLATSLTSPIHAQERPQTHPVILESSLDGGAWKPVPTTDLQTLPDGRIWLPFQDRTVHYRLRPGSSGAAGTPAPRPLSHSTISHNPQEGAFLTLIQSENLEDWRPLDGNQLSVDQQSILFPLTAERGFWNLEVLEKSPDPLPVPPLRIYPNPEASFKLTPVPSNGTAGGGSYLEPFDGPREPVPSPGPHAFNQYIFEERVHQMYEGDVKGYAVVLANEDGFQSTVSGGLARDPNDGERGMSTYRPGNVGSVAKLYSGVALMQLITKKTSHQRGGIRREGTDRRRVRSFQGFRQARKGSKPPIDTEILRSSPSLVSSLQYWTMLTMKRMDWMWFLLASAALVPAVPAQELPPGLVLHFDFDEVENNQVSNLAGLVPDGIAKEARFVPIKGFGHALALRQNDEQTHYVDVADHAVLNEKTFTVAAWICPRRVDVSGAIACKHDWLDAGYRGFTLRINVNCQLNFTIGAERWTSANSTSLLQPNAWVHVAGTFDGKKLMVYFNGKLEDTTEVANKYTPSPYPLRIGHGTFKLDTHRKFDGKIDDLMIWNRCLTAAELKSLNKPTNLHRPPPPTAVEITPLVKLLANEDYATRRVANLALLEMGPSIVPELEKLKQNPNPEIRVRLRVLIKKLRPAPIRVNLASELIGYQ